MTANTLRPIYTSMNCQFCAPLQWGLTLFWRHLAIAADWYETLQNAIQRDGIRLVTHRLTANDTSQFLVNSTPDVSPLKVVQRVKGRLVYILREECPKPLKGNYAIRSIGKVARRVVENYVSHQLDHHQMADEAVQDRMNKYQIEYPNDLLEMQKTTHGVYWYNLHVVLVHQQKWKEIRENKLSAIQAMVTRIAEKKEFRLSRLAILADHIHLVLGGKIHQSPSDIALALLNNLAYAHGMTPVYQYGGFVGTVGEYTTNAI